MAFDGRLFADTRTRHRYSQRALAKAAGVAPSFVASLEAGNSTDPGYRRLKKVCRILDVDPDLFFEDLAQNYQQGGQTA